jgi:hypothetical protein
MADGIGVELVDDRPFGQICDPRRREMAIRLASIGAFA